MLTLVEAAKRAANNGEVQKSAVIQLYAETSPILEMLPFEDIPGNALKYNLEGALPGIGFRGVNEGYTESTGVINPQTESLVIAGGDLDVDIFIRQTMGSSQRATQEAMKVKALAHRFSNVFIKGDSQTSPKEFDGLQTRLVGNQLIDAGNSSGGDALSLDKLDELIDAVDQPTALLMNRKMRRRLTAASRSTTLAGFIAYDEDSFGRRLAMYNDLPILVVDPNDSVYQTLAFDEANPGGGSNVGTSIYCLGLGEGRLNGIQNGGISVRDLGEQDSKPVERTRVEWYVSIALYHPRAASRLRGIKDAAVVA